LDMEWCKSSLWPQNCLKFGTVPGIAQMYSNLSMSGFSAILQLQE